MMDTDQAEFFETKTKEAVQGKPWLAALREKLLTIDGSGVVLWNGSNGEQFVAHLLDRGHVYSIENLGFRRGDLNRCHDNAQRWAERRSSQYTYATGYALAKQIWRPHSWLIDFNKKQVIETTVRMEVYFGFDYPVEKKQ